MRQTTEQKTQHLVALAQDGNNLAINQLCQVYWPRVHWIVRLRMGRKLRKKLESVDLVQDALFSAVQDIGNFTYQNEGDFLRWLARIVENRLRVHFRRFHAHKRDMRKEVPLDGPARTTDASSRTAWQALDTTTPSVILSKKED